MTSQNSEDNINLAEAFYERWLGVVPSQRECLLNGKNIELTKSLFDFFLKFAKNPDKFLSEDCLEPADCKSKHDLIRKRVQLVNKAFRPHFENDPKVKTGIVKPCILVNRSKLGYKFNTDLIPLYSMGIYE